MTAGLRLTGLVAPFVLDSPINRDVFQTYLNRVLVPELSPGDIVVMDNLFSHKGLAVRAAIGATGARLLHLPPYSLLTKLQRDRTRFRQAQGAPAQSSRANRRKPLDSHRTSPPRHQARECANYFKAAGYEQD